MKFYNVYEPDNGLWSITTCLASARVHSTALGADIREVELPAEVLEAGFIILKSPNHDLKIGLEDLHTLQLLEDYKAIKAYNKDGDVFVTSYTGEVDAWSYWVEMIAVFTNVKGGINLVHTYPSKEVSTAIS